MTLDITLFYIAFWLYLAGFLFFSVYIAFRKSTIQRIATGVMALGLIPQTIAIIVRWIHSEHVPLSNMYEYISLMSWMAVVLLLVLILKYKKPLVGSFIAPLVFMLMVTASLLPKEVSQMLVPALQSYWITIHVTLAAFGSGAFVVACAVSFIYLIKVYNGDADVILRKKSVLWWIITFIAFPFAFHFILRGFGFQPTNTFAILLFNKPITDLGMLMISLGFSLPLTAILYSFVFLRFINDKGGSHFGSAFFALMAFSTLLSALLAGIGNTNGWFTLTPASSLRIFEFFGVILILLWPIFFLGYALLIQWKQSFLHKIEFNLDLLDEINYKAITLGYPLYTIGALFAGAIWAEQAWGTFWSWDPKEVGSLIIWLFYSGFLHARYNRQWKGSKAAILAVFGFVMVLLSFFGNYFFGGQHSYT